MPRLHIRLYFIALCFGFVQAHAAQPRPTLPPANAALPPSTQLATANNSSLDAALFYQILVGELQFLDQDPGSAYAFMLDAARKAQAAELYRRAVDIALQARSGNAALVAAQEWAKAHPQSQDPQRYSLQILLALNRPQDIATPLQKLIELSPKEQQIELILATPKLLARTTDGAATLQAVQTAFQPFLKSKHTAPAAWSALAQLLRREKRHSQAVEAAQKALKADPAFLPAVAVALDLMEDIPQTAEPLVQQFLQQAHTPAQTPSHQLVQLGLARAYTGLNRHAQAQHLLTPLLQQKPDWAEAWLLQGALYAQQNQLAPAQSALEKYLALLENNPQTNAAGKNAALLQLAQMAELRRDYAQAHHWLDQIQDSTDPMLLPLRRASLLARQGQLAQARSLLQQTPKLQASDTLRALQAEAQLLMQHQQYTPALQVLNDAHTQFPDDNQVLYELALVHEKTGQPERMESLLRELIARQPNNHHALNALGYALADRNERLPEAKALIQKALSTVPNEPYILDSLGWVEFRLGNKEAALQALQTAFRLQPDADIAAHLGEVHWSLKQTDAALAIWKKGLQLNPGNDTLRATLVRLGVSLEP